MVGGLRDKSKELKCNKDDVVDAVCLAVVASIKSHGQCETVPKVPEKDAEGLYMQMVIPEEHLND